MNVCKDDKKGAYKHAKNAITKNLQKKEARENPTKL